MARRTYLPVNENDRLMKRMAKSYLDACIDSAAVWTGFFAVLLVIGTIFKKDEDKEEQSAETPSE